MSTKQYTKGIIEEIRDAKSSEQVKGSLQKLQGYRDAKPSTVRKAKREADKKLDSFLP